jgi:putative peptidoglycan lipid II flippase
LLPMPDVPVALKTTCSHAGDLNPGLALGVESVDQTMTPGEGGVFSRRARMPTFVRRGREHASQPLTIFLGMCLSMLVGIVFQGYLASRLGTGLTVDTFYLGTTVPTLLATIVLGSAANALMRLAVSNPGLLRFCDRGAVPFRLVWISLAVSVGVGALGLALMLGVLPVFQAKLRTGVGELLLLTTPVPLMALVAAIGAVRALARRRFVIGTYGGAVNGVGLLVGALLLSGGGLGAPKLGVAVDCGYLLQVLFVWSVLRSDTHRDIAAPRASDGDVIARRATRMFLLLAGASAVYKSQPLVERLVGEALGAGIPAALGYAEKITVGLTQLAVFGFSLAALPLLSQSLHERRPREAISRLQFALAATFASVCAVVAFGLVSSDDLVRVFYERGAFGRHSAAMTNVLVLCALPSVACGALAGPLVSLWYADGRVRQVAGIGLCGFLAGTGATVVLVLILGYRGIVLGTGVGYLLTFAIFATRAKTVLTEWSWRAVFARFGPAMAVTASTVMGVSIISRLLIGGSSASLSLSLTYLTVRLAILLLASFGTLVLLTRRHSPPTYVTRP